MSGVSACHMTSGKAPAISSGPMSMTWCSVPSSSATSCWKRALVVMRVLERDRERAQLVVGLLVGQRRREAGVQPARQVACRRGRRRAGAARRSSSRSPSRLPPGRGVVVRLPPRPLRDDPAALPDDQLAGREHVDAAERRARRARGPRREDVVDAAEVRLGRDHTGGEQRLGLRAEDDRAVVEQRPVQRVDAEAVAHQRQRARGPAPTSANANWPFSLSSAARPSRSNRRSTTSVSLGSSR